MEIPSVPWDCLAYKKPKGSKKSVKVTRRLSLLLALPNAAQFRFYKEQRQDKNPELVAALINMSARKLSKLEPDLQISFDLNQFYQFHDQKDEHPEQVKVLIGPNVQVCEECFNRMHQLCHAAQAVPRTAISKCRCYRGMRFIKIWNDDAIYQVVEGVIPIVDDVEVDVDDEKDYLISMFYDGSPWIRWLEVKKKIKDSTVRVFLQKSWHKQNRKRNSMYVFIKPSGPTNLWPVESFVKK